MSRFSTLFQNLGHCIQQREGLDLEYKGKTKGSIYQTKKTYYLNKEQGIRKNIKEFGTTALVWEVKITYKKSTGPNTYMLETHQIHYAGISEEDLKAFMEMNYKNIIKLHINPVHLGTIKFIKTPKQK